MNEEILFHYTSEVGLQGILQNKCLWATDAFASNDASEIKLGEDFAKRALKEFGLKERALELVTNAREKFSRGVFLACFSTLQSVETADEKLAQKIKRERDFILENGLLSQWRGYGSYSIKFKRNKLEEAVYKDGNKGISVSGEVHYLSSANSECEYDDFKGGDVFKEMMKEEKFFKKISNSKDQINNLDFKDLGNAIKSYQIPALLVKNYGFHEETEVRIANLVLPEEYDKRKIHFRAPNKSYIKLFEEDQAIIENAIEEIIIGPVSDQKAAKHWVDSMLREFGYKNVKVKCSEIPFRKS